MTPARNPKRILFASIGSLGDLHPVFGLAVELKHRGHAVTIAATPFYRERVEALGVQFMPLRPDWDPTDASLIAQCENIRRGPEILLRKMVLPHLRDTYADLMNAAQNAGLMIAGELVYAAPLVAEKLELRWASAILSPCTFFSVYDPPVIPPVQELEHLRWTGPAFHRALLKLSSAMTNHWWRPIHELRRDEGLGPGRHPLLKDKFSPDLVLAMFSRALATPQQDWPMHTAQTGFVFHDKLTADDQLPDDLRSFLDTGPPPIVFTQGSTAVHNPGSFYETSIETAEIIGHRALLIGTSDARHAASANVYIAEYAPYSQVFSRCAAIVHQGGVGTTGAAMRAGRPMLIVPYGWDQPDHAARITRMGAGLTIARKHYTPKRAAGALARLISEESFATHAAKMRDAIQAEDGTSSACNAIESLLMRA